MTWNEIRFTRTTVPSIPPPPDRPVTSTFVKPQHPEQPLAEAFERVQQPEIGG